MQFYPRTLLDALLERRGWVFTQDNNDRIVPSMRSAWCPLPEINDQEAFSEFIQQKLEAWKITGDPPKAVI